MSGDEHYPDFDDEHESGRASHGKEAGVASRSALSPGTALGPGGRYVVQQVLHSQSLFSFIYLGHQQDLDREVVIKELFPRGYVVRDGGLTVQLETVAHTRTFQESLANFLHEGRLLAKLGRCPHIVQVFDVFEANGTAYLVMEHVAGQNLSDSALRGEAVEPDRLRELLLQLTEALKVVHGVKLHNERDGSQGVLLHRDIKPENIIIRADNGEPVLVDFGAARFAYASATKMLTRVFTPGYAPPEQMSTLGVHPQGPWTDLYSLAATMHSWLTGEPPLSSEDRAHIKSATGTDPLPRLSERLAGRGYDKALLETLDQCLLLDAALRPRSVDEFVSRVTEDDEPLPPEPPPPEPEEPEELAGRSPYIPRWKKRLAAAAVICITGLTGMTIVSNWVLTELGSSWLLVLSLMLIWLVIDMGIARIRANTPHEGAQNCD